MGSVFFWLRWYRSAGVIAAHPTALYRGNDEPTKESDRKVRWEEKRNLIYSIRDLAELAKTFAHQRGNSSR